MIDIILAALVFVATASTSLLVFEWRGREHWRKAYEAQRRYLANVQATRSTLSDQVEHWQKQHDNLKRDHNALLIVHADLHDTALLQSRSLVELTTRLERSEAMVRRMAESLGGSVAIN